MPWESNTLFKNLEAAYAPDALDRQADEEILKTTDTRTPAERTADWQESIAIRMATAGFYTRRKHVEIAGDTFGNGAFENRGANPRSLAFPAVDRAATSGELQDLLNNAHASYGGMVMQFAKGVYNLMCTRNHNFSNRDQKAHLVVH